MTDLFGQKDDILEQQIRCVEREIGMRQRVYPNWINAKKMSAGKAEYEIQMMQEVLKSLNENAQLKEQIERLEKQLNKQGEQVLTMIDLLLKSYFYLSAARDCKLTLEHCGNIGILCDLINKCFKDLGK